MKIGLIHSYLDIISLDNLLSAWQEFIKGKRKRKDVLEFQAHLMDNLLSLHSDLANFTYIHGPYQSFNISDPKPRNIHKATVRDRVLHRAIYRILYPFFDKTFIADSFSCRLNKGTHKALNRFRAFAYQVSQNHTQTCWVLKCDIKKFFASINHDVLLNALSEYIPDKVFIKTIHSGVDFLGWVHFTDHRVLRMATRRRMLKRIRENLKEGALDSYLGLVKHGNAEKIKVTPLGL